MILMIERDVPAWAMRILDNIRSISVSSQIIVPRAKLDDELGDDVIIIDKVDLYDSTNQNEVVKFKRVSCRTNDNREFSVVFDTRAFICNDDGSTIYKIDGSVY